MPYSQFAVASVRQIMNDKAHANITLHTITLIRKSK
jgi:hypothetical protein